MPRETGLVVFVVLVLVAHEVYLAWSVARTRVRLLSLERFVRAELARLAAVEQAPAPSAALVSSVTELDDDDACTKVWTGRPAALVEAAARGANPSSQATPRADLAMDVAPRAAASAPKPSDDDGETTSALAHDPPMYAARLVLGATTRAPLADPDLIGSEDQAEEAARHRLALVRRGRKAKR